MKKHLFISPHLDDAILSCGPYIYHLTKQKQHVTIATVFTGSLLPNQYSPLAKWFHKLCGLGDNAMQLRCLEDKKACNVLNASSIHLNLPECLYRMNENGHPLYLVENKIYQSDLDYEKNIINQLISVMMAFLDSQAFDHIYIPIGIGQHVDHLILRHCISHLSNLGCFDHAIISFYEDIPYVLNTKDEYWRNELLSQQLQINTYEVKKEDFYFYMKALNCYDSQITMLWNSKTDMKTQLKHHFSSNRSDFMIGHFWQKH